MEAKRPTHLTNSFHNRGIYTSKTREQIDAILDTLPDNRTYKDRAWIRRVHSALCGVKGCACGRNELGER